MILPGALDAIIILHNVDTDTYHASYFVEAPMPGPVVPVDQLEIVRLKSRMHHTRGAATLAAARVHAIDLGARVEMDERNIFDEPMEWDGELGLVIVVPNWRKQ